MYLLAPTTEFSQFSLMRKKFLRLSYLANLRALCADLVISLFSIFCDESIESRNSWADVKEIVVIRSSCAAQNAQFMRAVVGLLA